MLSREHRLDDVSDARLAQPCTAAVQVRNLPSNQDFPGRFDIDLRDRGGCIRRHDFDKRLSTLSALSMLATPLWGMPVPEPEYVAVAPVARRPLTSSSAFPILRSAFPPRSVCCGHARAKVSDVLVFRRESADWRNGSRAGFLKFLNT